MRKIFLMVIAVLMLLPLGRLEAGHLEDIAARGTIPQRANMKALTPNFQR